MGQIICSILEEWDNHMQYLRRMEEVAEICICTMKTSYFCTPDTYFSTQQVINKLLIYVKNCDLNVSTPAFKLLAENDVQTESSDPCYDS